MSTRGVCPVCRRLIGVRKNGRLRGHGYRAFNDSWCAGSCELPRATVHVPPRGQLVSRDEDWFEDLLHEPRL